MSKDAIEGVLAHEISHIANGDMVRMTLIQGVVNAFVMFFSRIAAFMAGQAVKEEMQQVVHFIVYILCEIVFGILSILLVNWFSRQREFRADA
ncbi:MAG: M48 family metalloprotease, partial [SAR324 cluster bacterium]|nr:M48 family metalloprotease [SAR324 cluster bacterium]